MYKLSELGLKEGDEVVLRERGETGCWSFTPDEVKTVKRFSSGLSVVYIPEEHWHELTGEWEVNGVPFVKLGDDIFEYGDIITYKDSPKEYVVSQDGFAYGSEDHWLSMDDAASCYTLVAKGKGTITDIDPRPGDVIAFGGGDPVYTTQEDGRLLCEGTYLNINYYDGKYSDCDEFYVISRAPMKEPALTNSNEGYEEQPILSGDLFGNWAVETGTTIVSDGGPTEYYDFLTGWKTWNDLADYKASKQWKEHSFHLGNIGKAIYRWGDKKGTTKTYDAKKIVYSGLRVLMMLEDKAYIQEYLEELTEDPQFN